MKELSKDQKKALIAICCFAFCIYFQHLTRTSLAYIINSYPDYSATDVSRVMTIPSLVGLFVSVAMGPIAMKISKKILVCISLGCMLAYYLIFAAVGSNGPISLLYLGAGFCGLTTGSALILVNSYIGVFFPQEKRATFVALSTSIANLGSVFVNIVGGSIAAGNNGADWPKAYFLGLILLVCMIIFLALIPKYPEDTPDEEVSDSNSGTAGKTKVKIPLKVFALIAVGITTSLSLSAYLYFISRYIINDYQLGTSVHTGIANSLYSFTGLFIGLTYVFWHKLFKKYIATVGLILFTIGNLLITIFTKSLPVVLTASAIISAGFNLYNPYYVSQIMAVTPKKILPLTLAMQVAGINIGMFFALDIVTFLGEAIGPELSNMFLVGTIGGVIVTAASYFVYIVWKNPVYPEDELSPKI